MPSLKNSLLRELADGPKSVKQLKRRLGVNSKKIKKVLDVLIQRNKVLDDKGIYSLRVSGAPVLEATLVKLGKSFGFASASDGSGDIFIPGRLLMGAMPGDEMVVRMNQTPRFHGTREGEVIRILKPQQRFVGNIIKMDGRLALVPDNAPDTPVLIGKNHTGGVQQSDKAAGEMLRRGERHSEHRISITMKFGSTESAKQCAEAELYAAHISKSFPPEVLQEAEAVSKLQITEKDLINRIDLRDMDIFTIDSADTKDIDDAVSAAENKNGYTIGVHIADVSHYVLPKTQLDTEAFSRGTSIYFADQVIPMLPKQLSNGICSLNPGEDRLAFSCFIELDKSGRMVDYKFSKSVIKSRLKGVYSEINSIIEKRADEAITRKYSDLQQSLEIMHKVFLKLAKLRTQRGCMDIESEEASLIVDAVGKCVDVKPRQRGISERMIEEFMLLANGAAANFARTREIPFVYRVHDKPSAERVENLKNMLTAAGIDYSFAGEIPTQREYSELLDKYRNTSLEKPVHNSVLRSMAKAVYEEIPKGHYGLVLDDYAHFTSPIRRYPDLVIHRILNDTVNGMEKQELEKRYSSFVQRAAQQSSKREVQAQQLERHCDDIYKAEYMQRFIGQSFTGVISSVTSFGLYVELENSVEGLVHVSYLSENHMDLVEGVSLSDPLSGKSYALGQPLQVTVAGVDISRGNIDFIPSENGVN